MEEHKFTGVFIPAAVWLNRDLTWLQKCLLGEIDALTDKLTGGACYASNEYLAGMMDSSPASVANMLSDLRKKGWIETGFQGRKRLLRVVWNLNPQVKLNPTVKAELTGELSDLNPGVNIDTKEIITKESPSGDSQLSLTLGGKIDLFDVAAYWNRHAIGLATVRDLPESRKAKLRSRLKEPFFCQHFETAVAKIAASSFCCGKNQRNWKADFDWLIENDKNICKVIEGKFDDREEGGGRRQARSDADY